MESSLLHYLKWRGDVTFSGSDFNKVDAAILAHLTYEHIEGLVSSSFNEPVLMRNLSEDFKSTHNLQERTSMGVGINPKTPEILYACGDSARFGNVKVCGFREILSEDLCEQFAAVTYIFDNTAVVAFRGTDDTVIGWCEDLLLGKSPIIRSHTDGLQYLNEVADAFSGKLIVLGHSKGGSVAVYSATKTSKKNQNRIKSVYNFDGPGWEPSFYETSEYKHIEKKVFSLYPKTDIVGKIFYPNSNFIIVKSLGKGIEQHDMLNWYCVGPEFVQEKDYSTESKLFYKSLNEWYETVSPEKREIFIDALIRVYKSCGYKTNEDITKNKIVSTKNMLVEFNKLDKETRNGIHSVLSDLRKVVAKELPIFNFLSDSKDFFNKVNKVGKVVKK